MRIDLVAYIGAWIAALIVMLGGSGCSSSSGWRVEFGVSPVNQLDNSAQFRARETEERAEGNAKTVRGNRY